LTTGKPHEAQKDFDQPPKEKITIIILHLKYLQHSHPSQTMLSTRAKEISGSMKPEQPASGRHESMCGLRYFAPASKSVA